MQIKKPLITILMPAYNSERFISEAIDSMLNQTFKNFEFLIINDASTDKTSNIIRNYQKKDKRIRVITNKKNLKLAATLNIGINKAKSEIIARMDPDDISHPDRLSIQYQFLKSHPKVAIVGANIRIINDNKLYSKREYPTTSVKLKRIMFRYSPFAHPAIMFRKKVFEEFGGYDETMAVCEDIDLWFKIGRKYEFANIPKTLLTYRLVPSSRTHSNLKTVETIGFKIKFKAFFEYGYTPSFYDILYNLLEFISLWITPDKIRIWAYNFLRSKKII